MCQTYIAMLGYTNNSNACYFNSLMASLLSCDSFVTKASETHLGKILLECGDDLSKFISKLDWTRVGRQECAHEALTRLIDVFGLHDIFDIHLSTYNVCGCTRELKPMEEILTSLTLSTNVTASNILNSVTDGEICKTCQNNYKHYYIVSGISNIIVIVLNKYYGKGMLDFTDQLIFDLDNGSKATYNLKAQVEHSGSQSGGHYTCKIKRGDEWFYVNDRLVQACEPGPTSNSYLLFYSI